MSQNKTEALKKVKKLNQIIRRHHPHIEDNDWAYLSMYLDQWFETTKVTTPLSAGEEKPKKLTEKQKKVKNLIDKNATETKTFTGNTEEMKQIGQHLDTGKVFEVGKEETLLNMRDYLCHMEKSSGCVKLSSQFLIGKMIKIYLDSKDVEEAKVFFGKGKTQLYNYVKLFNLLQTFPQLSVIGADFTLLVHNHTFIREYITWKKYDYSKISQVEATISVKTELGEQMEGT
jgi:hypothetical protein